MSDLRSALEAGHGADGGEAGSLHAVYVREQDQYRLARVAGDWHAAWRYLERAHIVAQPRFFLHLSSHLDMLKFAISQRDLREILGQMLRIALVPLGALTGRLPTGNIGRARVSAFAPMPVPDDLQRFLRPDAS